MPRGSSVWQSVLHDQAYGDRHDPMRVMTPGEGQIRRGGVEIIVAARAVMLRTGEVDIVGVPRGKVPQVVQKTLNAPQARGSRAATRTLATFIVAATNDNFGLGQICDTRDALCHVAKVFTGSGHGNILQGMRCSLGYIAQFPLSTPEKLCIFATVSHEVIFPVVSEATLRDLVKEWKATGPFYRAHVQTVMRSAYRSHYRRMLPPLLEALEFRSNNATHQPLIRALTLLKRYLPSRVRTYPVEEDVPLEGVIRDHWREAVIETDAQGRQRVNRLTYEMGVLQTLRDQLRCKEIWVVGADRYRNPDEDVPQDFEVHRPTYYAALKLPSQAADFIEQVQQEMRDELAALDHTLPRNADVEILPKAKGWIKLSPLAPQPEPSNLVALKMEISKRWPMTSLLDVLKETDLRVDFTRFFRSPTPWENLDRATLQYRLLLALYGLGTGAGLKRVAMGNQGLTYRELLYVRRRFITPEAVRQSIAVVVNRLFEARLPQLWGDDITACASDSRHFRAWDQNLLTCRPQSRVYLLTVENLLVLRSRRHDRRRITPLHRHGSRPAVRR
jgi:hypothetical protein